jgi:hypothetical protein
MESTLLLTAQIGFVALSFVYLFLFLRELGKGIETTSWEPARKKNYKKFWIRALVIWGVLVSAWSLSGIMGNFENFPFNFAPVIVIPLAAIIYVTFSQSLKEILQNIPVENLIRLQSFRFFVEIMLWLLFLDNFIPVQMTFEGRNLDILAGITAPIIASLAARGKIARGALIAWNLICLAFLVNIVTIAILSTPSPVRVFMEEPANRIVTVFPVSWLPGFLVPLAYMLNFF